MILTYKIKHNRDFSIELEKARKVAEFAIANRDKLSTKYVKHIGLKARVSKYVLTKYGQNKNCKRITRIKLGAYGIDMRVIDGKLWCSPLKLTIPLDHPYERINAIEVDNTYVYLALTVREESQYKPVTHIGVDLNTTGHAAVLAVKETGKVYKLGKKAEHIHKKYNHIRRALKKKGLFRVIKRIKNRESLIINDLNHKISRKIVDVAVAVKGGVQLEKLQGIRRKGVRKNFKYALNSWSFYKLGEFIEYKATLAGVPVTYIDPSYTSKTCSSCGTLGYRNDKLFKCPCGYVEHADVNAAFNIALPSQSIVQLQAVREAGKGGIGTSQKATH